MRDDRHIDKYYYRNEGIFYEPFDKFYKPNNTFLKIIEEVLQKEKKLNFWQIIKNNIWFYVTPNNIDLPLQGWKIHISATLINAKKILKEVSSLLVEKGIPFKFVLDERILTFQLNKGRSRGEAGKFITIYPLDSEIFANLLNMLYNILLHEEGPYILSDKRYKDCKVLYYRYGGLKLLEDIDIIGRKKPIIKTPNDEIYYDKRTPYFNLPPWVEDPFSKKTEVRLENLTLKNNRYKIEKALHFSNSGGVYLAEDSILNGKVVIKEARPYTNIDDLGNDSFTLLNKEYKILKLLEDTNLVPKAIDMFREWEHLYLVETFEEGNTMREMALTNSPLMKVKLSTEETKTAFEKYRKAFINLTAGLKKIHDRGIILGDLSPNNVIMKNYNIKFIDLESSFRPEMDKPTYLYTPGFRKKERINMCPDYKDDLYALGALMFYSIFPISQLSELREDLYGTVLKVILKDLGWLESFFPVINGLIEGTFNCDEIILLLSEDKNNAKPKYHSYIKKEEIKNMVNSMGSFILKHFECGEDRLCPADPFIYYTNPLSLGFGATGVMYALKKCGFEIPNKAKKWLEFKLKSMNPKDYPPGFLTGLAGISLALLEIGYPEKAKELLELANNHPMLTKHTSFFYGMAGIGMANLYFFLKTGERSYLDFAKNLGELLIEEAKEDEKGIFWINDGKIHIGFGYGQAGVALFLLRLFQITNNNVFFSIGKKSIEYDLSYENEYEKSVPSFPGDLKDTTTLEPYIESGTGGIIKVLLRYGMYEKAEKLIPDVYRKYAVFSGYIYGLGSFVDVLTDAYIYLKDNKYLQYAKRPIAGIKQIYLIEKEDGFAIPGDNLYRISCDLATGSAGIMKVLQRYISCEGDCFTLDTLDKQKFSR